MKKRYYLLLFLGITFLLRGVIYRLCVNYERVGQRELSVLPEGPLKTAVARWATAHPQASVRQITRFAARQTARQLSFVSRSTPSDPAQTVTLRVAHCVGYSRLFAAVVTEVLTHLPAEHQLEQQHYVGQLHLWGYNLHGLTDSPFWADHDFNCVSDSNSNVEICVDPTLYDYLGVRRVISR